MGRRGLVVLGCILVVIGGLLLSDTLGVLALNTHRLADYWPLVFVLLGLLVLLEAWAPDRHSEVREPAVGASPSPDADELERRLQERLDRLLASRPSEAPSLAEAAPVVSTPQAGQPVGEREPRQADVVAALLELQGLRRNRLISKREYRAQRSELVARMRPLPVTQPCLEPAAAGEGGRDDEGLPESGSWASRPPG